MTLRTTGGQALAVLLEAEYRQLSQEARKSEGLASFFSTADHPEVKEAAERAVLKIRSVADAPDAVEQVRNSKEILKPLQLACDTKSPKLISHALSTAQKLLANGALSTDGTAAIVGILTKVEKSSDENVQLKLLQTALTLLQSAYHPTSLEDICSVLGSCFRMLSSKGHKETVVSTATATVRQAVALVFSYVDIEAELAQMRQNLHEIKQGRELRSNSTEGAQCADYGAPQKEKQASNEVDEAPFTALDLHSGKTISAEQSQLVQTDELESPTVQAAHKLLEDLCAIATGAAPKWLKTPSLPRTFVLEMLDFVLTNSAQLFRCLPAFENTLSVWISQLLGSQLQDHLDAGSAGSSMAMNSFSAFKAVLRATRTVLRNFYPQIGMRCGPMVQGLLKGLHPKIPLFQRIAVMQVVKQLLGDGYLVYFLFASFDMQPELKVQSRPELKFLIIQAAVQSCTDIVDGMLKSANKDPEDDPPLDLVIAMCHYRTQGTGWNMDTEYEHAQLHLQSTYLSLLAVDALMAFTGSVEKLTEIIVLEEGCVTQNTCPGGVERIEVNVCRSLVSRNWSKMLSVFRELLSRSNGEAMILLLLKGYQMFTQACGMLEMLEPRDAFLGTLCEFALSSVITGDHDSVDAAKVSERVATSRAVGDREEGLVLFPKNVQSMRALFNIAHRLSNVLGPAWSLVLETMYTLDTILHSPHTTAQEMSDQSGEERLCSDVAILSAAASQMFECTRDMSREAVVSLLSGLRDVSIKHVPSAVQVQQPKLFALQRMVEVLLFNKSRIYDLWAIFLSHILELANDVKAAVRVASIDALDRAIVGTLDSPKEPQRRTGEDDAGTTGNQSSGVEHMLLVALESLYSGNTERDVQLGVLRTLLNVLQRHGERLSDGWTPVFRLLACVPAQKDAEKVDLAFQSVQLTCSDYMAAMPFEKTKRSLEVAAMYGSQQVELNVSLTAISLLWNAADTLGKSGSSMHLLRNDATRVATSKSDTETAGQDADSAVSPRSPGESRQGMSSSGDRATLATDEVSTKFSPAQIEDLIQLVFVALQCLAMDLRPEVRNSGVRSLFAVIVNQGPRLSEELWERCLWEMLFPLLRHAYRMSANSERGEAEAQVLGSTRGKQVHLMVHHSRNSEQKQWDETVVIALGGMARLLKSHLLAVVRLEAFPAAWEELMVVVESSMAGGRKEVALASIQLLGSVLQAHAGGGTPGTQEPSAISKVMWKRGMRVVDVGVEAATSPGCQVPLQARIELVNMIGGTYAALKARYDEEDTQQVFTWLERFCKSPWSDDDATNAVHVAVGLPPVQKLVLGLLPSLGPTHIPHLWPELIYMLVRLLKPQQVVERWRKMQQAKEETAMAEKHHQHAVEPADMPAAVGTARASQHATAKSLASASSLQSAGAFHSSEISPAIQSDSREMDTVGSGRSATARAAVTSISLQHKVAFSTAFLEKLLEALVVLFREKAPIDAQVISFPAMLAALSRGMEIRHLVLQESVWRYCVKAFIEVVPAGLSAMQSAHEKLGCNNADGPVSLIGSQANHGVAASLIAAWEQLAVAFEVFLLGVNARHASTGSGAPFHQIPAADNIGGLASNVTRDDPGMISSANSHTRDKMDGVGDAGQLEPQNLDPARCRADAELEVSLLDTLADVVLTSAGHAPRDIKQRLIRTIDNGICRPQALNIQQVATGAGFSHVCLRKLYSLCSRGGTSLGAARAMQTNDQVYFCLLEIAQLALPVLLARCDLMLRDYLATTMCASFSALQISSYSPAPGPRLDEVMCVLEVLASMTLVREVVDAALTGNESLQQLVQLMRSRPEMSARGRERTHLLLLYPVLCEGITCKDVRLREMVKDVLQLAGAELGLGMGGSTAGLREPLESGVNSQV